MAGRLYPISLLSVGLRVLISMASQIFLSSDSWWSDDNAEWRCCDSIVSYIAALSTTQKDILKGIYFVYYATITESKISIHAANIICILGNRQIKWYKSYLRYESGDDGVMV